MPGFNTIATHYNAMTGFPRRIDRLVELIGPWVTRWQVKRALDSGCGHGALLFALARLGVHAAGIDASEPMLRLALSNARDLGVPITIHSATHATASKLYPDTFDAVFTIGNALVNAPSEREMTEWLRGLYGALRPGGHLLIQNLNLTPFLLGLKTQIARRQVGDTEYVRFAKPAPHGGLNFCVTMRGPDGVFDAQFSQWYPWEAGNLGACVADAGFREIEFYGSIEGAEYKPRESTDLVITATR